MHHKVSKKQQQHINVCVFIFYGLTLIQFYVHTGVRHDMQESRFKMHSQIQIWHDLMRQKIIKAAMIHAVYRYVLFHNCDMATHKNPANFEPTARVSMLPIRNLQCREFPWSNPELPDGKDQW